MPNTPTNHAKLLATRICDLALASHDSWIEAQIAVLYRDLTRAGLVHFRPRVYWGDEWFSPQGLPAIAAPFYLATPTLRQLSQGVIKAPLEGGTPTTCRMLLRHEAGHCFDHAYNLSQTRAFRRVFGDSTKPYDPDAFVPDRQNKHFVRHLPGFYAQAHPDEDFAETFAVVLVPKRAQRSWSEGSPQLRQKLTLAAEFIKKYADRRPLVYDDGSTDYAAARMRSTLARYFERLCADQARAARRRARQVPNH